ncbi:uncharacterized protein LOC112597202 [Melanaphis sacchari]|uniref:uncharacterized protein LOC112597202 n=1 Tax=Melanaphis sacchari TaxID=742174 RepID=UPI000DC141CE|nr:uncharacterized protein LOC112597202 [Melanaphis sacchari]
MATIIDKSSQFICCVVSCNNSKKTGHKLFSFPNKPHEKKLKKMWIKNINRINKDGTPWMPDACSVICGEHFVGNKPSKDPNSPAYVPIKFINIFKTKENDDLQELCRKLHCNEPLSSELSLEDIIGTTDAVFCLLADMLAEPGPYIICSKNLKLFIFLVKIKLDINFKKIGIIYGISHSTVFKIFSYVLNVLYNNTKQFIDWPSKDTISATLPNAFKQNYPYCRCIIDCLEIEVDHSSTELQMVKMLSPYNNSYSIKFLIAITPNGVISFLSKGYAGNSSNAFIINDSGLLSKLEVGDQVLADKNFPSCDTNCEVDNFELIMSPILDNDQFIEEEIVNVRRHINICFAKLKTFKILNKMKKEFDSFIDKIMQICCTLNNLKYLPIVHKNKSCLH